MKEKKRFFIPKNYDKKFSFFKGVSGWANLAILPVAGASYFVITNTPFDVSNKILIVATIIGVPYMLISTKPIRENVPLYKHLYWRLKFMTRQRIFKYKKEGYVHENQFNRPIQQSRKTSATTGNEVTKGRSNSEKINPRFNTNKGHRKWVSNYSGQSDGSNDKSVGS